ncbi:MAG: hypothetical protein AB7T06_16165 [Kofleriaceae bacterium]
MQLRSWLVWVALVGCDNRESKGPEDAAIDAVVDASVDAMIDATKVCDLETRDDDYVAGMSKTGANGYRVVLVDSTPAPRPKGNYTWNVQILDPTTAPRDDVQITVGPFMPDHHHGTSVQAVVTSTGNGMYSISPINLFMTGYWTIRLGLRENATEVDFVIYAFCVD